MKLQESISALKAEKTNKVTSRFPCRVLLLHSREDYCDAVSSLRSLCDRSVSSDELLDGRPHYPYRRWSDRLPELTGGGYDECQKQKMYKLPLT